MLPLIDGGSSEALRVFTLQVRASYFEERIRIGIVVQLNEKGQYFSLPFHPLPPSLYPAQIIKLVMKP